MTPVVAEEPRTLSDWLDELVTAAPVDRRMVSIEGLRAQLGAREVTCRLHPTPRPMTWTQTFRHLVDSESLHRQRDGEGRLHQSGDLAPASPEADVATRSWRTEECGRCGTRVIWTTTQSGKSMPVDADPDPAGTFLVAASPEDARRPMAIALHTEVERAEAPAHAIHTTHMRTCRPKGRRSRRSGS